MDETIETLLVDVRASTTGFRADVEAMRGTLDTTLVDGFARAGQVLERGLLSAIRRGTLGFDDLKRAALSALGEIAAQSVQAGIGSLFGGGQSGGGLGGIAGLIGQFAGAFLGLPGRATGGPVSPHRPIVVGERGPELFVPTAAGRVEPNVSAPRQVTVSINVAQPRGASAPTALQRSSRQVAAAVRRALSES